MKITLTLMIVIITCSAFKLPSYMKKCNISDPKISECIVNQIPNIRPHLKDGIKELNIPPLVPFHIPKIMITAGSNLKIEMTDLDIFYLDHFNTSVNEAPGPSASNFSFYFNRIELIGTYDIDGQILFIPIKGHGPSNITLHNFRTDNSYSFKLLERNGNVYLDLYNHWFQFRSGNITLRLDNLFNGDKILGDQMNAFLNENWKDVEDLLRPSITETVIAIIGAIYQHIIDNVPATDMFYL